MRNAGAFPNLHRVKSRGGGGVSTGRIEFSPGLLYGDIADFTLAIGPRIGENELRR